MKVTADTGPFAVVPRWLLRAASAGAVRTYTFLAVYADREGECYPGQVTLASEMGVCERSVRNYLAELKRVGALTVKQRGQGQTAVYHLHTKDPDRQPSSGLDRQPVSGRTRTSRKTDSLRSSVLPARARDAIWDALVAELGEPATKTERGKRNAAVKQLRDVGATPEHIAARCRAYRRRWPQVDLTDTALVKHWTLMGENGRKDPFACECGAVFVSTLELREHREEAHAA